MDTYGASISVLIIAIMEMTFIMWGYGVNNFCKDVNAMLDFTPSIYFKVIVIALCSHMSSIDLKSQACWAFFSPAILAVIFIAAAASWQKPSYGEVLYPGVLLQVHTSDSLLCLLRLASWDWLGSHPPVLGADSVVDAGHHCGCRRAGWRHGGLQA